MPVGSRPTFRERLTLAVVRPEPRARDGTPVPGRGTPTPDGAAATLTTPPRSGRKINPPAGKGGGRPRDRPDGGPGGAERGRGPVRAAAFSALRGVG